MIKLNKNSVVNNTNEIPYLGTPANGTDLVTLKMGRYYISDISLYTNIPPVLYGIGSCVLRVMEYNSEAIKTFEIIDTINKKSVNGSANGAVIDWYSAGAGSLNDLLDVTVVKPIGDNQVLSYDSETDTWVPGYPTASIGITSFSYRYSTSDGTTPNAGVINTNNTADPTAVTTLYINAVDDTGTDISLFLDEISQGDWLNLYDKTNQAIEEAYDVAGDVVKNGNIYEVPVLYFTHSTTRLSNNGQIKLFWKRVQAEGAGSGTTVPIGTVIEVGKDLDLSSQGWINISKGDVTLPKADYVELEKTIRSQGSIQSAVVENVFQYNQSMQLTESGIVAYKLVNINGSDPDAATRKNIQLCSGWNDDTILHTIDLTAYGTPLWLSGVFKDNNGRSHIRFLCSVSGSSTDYVFLDVSYSSNAQTVAELASSLVLTTTTFQPLVSLTSGDTCVTNNYLIINGYRVFPINPDFTLDTNYYDISWTYSSDSRTGQYNEKNFLKNDFAFERGYLINLATQETKLVKYYDCAYSHYTFSIGDDVYLAYRTGTASLSCFIIHNDGSFSEVLNNDNSTAHTDAPFFTYGYKHLFQVDLLTGDYLNPEFLLDYQTKSYVTLADLIPGYNFDYSKVFYNTFLLYKNFRNSYLNRDYLYLFDDLGGMNVISLVVDTTFFTIKAEYSANPDKQKWIYTGVITN